MQTFPEPPPGVAGSPAVPGAAPAAAGGVGWAPPEATPDLPRRSTPAMTTSTPARTRGRALVGSPVDRLRPRTVGQLLDAGFEVVRFRFREVSTVAVVVALPLYVLPQVLGILSGAAPESGTGAGLFGDPVLSTMQSTQGDVATQLTWAYLATAGLWLASMLAGVGAGHQVTSWLTGSDPTAGETLRFVVRRAPVAIGAFVILLFVKGLATMFSCGVAMIVVVPMFSLTAPVIAAEGLGLFESIGRSRRLGSRRLGTLMGISILWGIVTMLVSLVVLIATSIIGGELIGSEDGSARVGQALGVFFTLALLVVQVAVTVLAYVDVRVRTEGLDLELDAAERLPHAVG